MNLSDRLKAAITAFVSQLTAKYDYAAKYAHTVVAQNADGTLELKPDSPNLPGLSNVPIRSLPGLAIKVSPGARVSVEFDGMDPSKPYATTWDQGGLTSLAFAGGNAPIARMGDTVSVFFPAVIPVTGVMLGSPFTGVITIATPAPGIINGGNPQLLG